MSRCGSFMRAFSQTSSAPLGVSSAGPARLPAPCQEPRRRSDSSEAVDLDLEAGALGPVADAEALLRGEGQHADLALVQVAVDVAGGLADLLHRVDPGQRRV